MVDYFPDQNNITEQKTKLESMIKAVMAEKFGATPGYQVCKYCDYFDICDEKEVEE